MLAWNRANPERVRASKKKGYDADPKKVNLRNKAWREKNPERVRQHWAAFHARNKYKEKEWSRKKRIKNREKNRATQKRYHAARPGLKNLWWTNRKAQKLRASLDWGEFNELVLREAYDLAKLRSKATGIAWHVDHIVPLKSRRVCGLHVFSNLQVIPGAENFRKSNVVWPDMP